MGSQLSCQSQARAGMTFAISSGVRFHAGDAEDIWVLRAGTFTQLDEADREVLLAWANRAGISGIDTVIDLAVRPWNVAGARVVVGVFEINKARASWLIVRHGSGWTLARCGDGFVSDVSPSLPDILTMIDDEVAGIGDELRGDRR